MAKKANNQPVKEAAAQQAPETVSLEQYNKLLEAAQKLEKENKTLRSALSGISSILSVLQ